MRNGRYHMNFLEKDFVTTLEDQMLHEENAQLRARVKELEFQLRTVTMAVNLAEPLVRRKAGQGQSLDLIKAHKILKTITDNAVVDQKEVTGCDVVK